MGRGDIASLGFRVLDSGSMVRARIYGLGSKIWVLRFGI